MCFGIDCPNISTEENGWGHNHLGLLRDVIAQLSAQQNGLVKHFKSHIIVDVLCDMVAHPSNHVRSCIVSLFNVVVGIFILKIVVDIY